MAKIDWEKNHGKIIHEGLLEDLYQDIEDLKDRLRKLEGKNN